MLKNREEFKLALDRMNQEIDASQRTKSRHELEFQFGLALNEIDRLKTTNQRMREELEKTPGYREQQLLNSVASYLPFLGYRLPSEKEPKNNSETHEKISENVTVVYYTGNGTYSAGNVETFYVNNLNYEDIQQAFSNHNVLGIKCITIETVSSNSKTFKTLFMESDIRDFLAKWNIELQL